MLHLPPTCCARLCCWHSHQPALGPPSNSAPDFPQELKAALDEAIAALARRPDLAAALWERLVAAVVVQPAAGEAAAVPRYDLSYQLNEIEVRERGEQLQLARADLARHAMAVMSTLPLLASCVRTPALCCSSMRTFSISYQMHLAGTSRGLLRGPGLCAPAQRAVAGRWDRLCCGLACSLGMLDGLWSANGVHTVQLARLMAVSVRHVLARLTAACLVPVCFAGGAELPDEGRGVAHLSKFVREELLGTAFQVRAFD